MEIELYRDDPHWVVWIRAGNVFVKFGDQDSASDFILKLIAKV